MQVFSEKYQNKNAFRIEKKCIFANYFKIWFRILILG